MGAASCEPRAGKEGRRCRKAPKTVDLRLGSTACLKDRSGECKCRTAFEPANHSLRRAAILTHRRTPDLPVPAGKALFALLQQPLNNAACATASASLRRR